MQGVAGPGIPSSVPGLVCARVSPGPGRSFGVRRRSRSRTSPPRHADRWNHSCHLARPTTRHRAPLVHSCHLAHQPPALGVSLPVGGLSHCLTAAGCGPGARTRLPRATARRGLSSPILTSQHGSHVPTLRHVGTRNPCRKDVLMSEGGAALGEGRGVRVGKCGHSGRDVRTPGRGGGVRVGKCRHSRR